MALSETGTSLNSPQATESLFYLQHLSSFSKKREAESGKILDIPSCVFSTEFQAEINQGPADLSTFLKLVPVSEFSLLSLFRVGEFIPV